MPSSSPVQQAPANHGAYSSSTTTRGASPDIDPSALIGPCMPGFSHRRLAAPESDSDESDYPATPKSSSKHVEVVDPQAETRDVCRENQKSKMLIRNIVGETVASPYVHALAKKPQMTPAADASVSAPYRIIKQANSMTSYQHAPSTNRVSPLIGV
ncbi:hypothetical protein H0H92_010283 [Tricholoma furcatifolium]|nr:hypothetical protein H0H92_010283 [Tricholoma furcatifolium]